MTHNCDTVTRCDSDNRGFVILVDCFYSQLIIETGKNGVYPARKKSAASDSVIMGGPGGYVKKDTPMKETLKNTY